MNEDLRNQLRRYEGIRIAADGWAVIGHAAIQAEEARLKGMTPQERVNYTEGLKRLYPSVEPIFGDASQ